MSRPTPTEFERVSAVIFDGLTIERTGKPWVDRAREQIAVGDRLWKWFASEQLARLFRRDDLVSVCHFLHPDGEGWRIGDPTEFQVHTMRLIVESFRAHDFAPVWP